MATGSRKGRDSRCCHPAGAPWTWLPYIDHEHDSCTELDDWLNSLASFARSIEQGEIDDLFDAASRGELWDTGDGRTPIKPIRLNPEIFELRRTALSKKLRFYHGEPDALPSALVSLHKHIKTGNPTQQVEIQHAADRYAEGQSHLWT